MIRPVADDEFEAALRMKNAAWREAYAGQLSGEVLAGLDQRVDEQASWWREEVERGIAPPLVAVDPAGRIVGIAAGGPARGDYPPVGTELHMVYVLAEAYGTGLARALVERSIGHAAALVWVLETNPRAVAFYRKLGFEPDGAREPLSERWNNCAEIRMVRGPQPQIVS
ncbi:GNAT family N-acetyltransferase [Arthrobacter sp. H5]|uniref:GNAT family N-acetyltransferase n=1 Tax=Arthrobacter sp. H5 TaxID=1267973 RepID=UPI00138AF952|nr:GNAT family N-acetyltransferase [Arthrobacter sp. H5]